MTKELALQQGLCDGAAVDFGESLVPTRREVVQPFCDEFFACASLADDQSGSVNAG